MLIKQNNVMKQKLNKYILKYWWSKGIKQSKWNNPIKNLKN